MLHPTAGALRFKVRGLQLKVPFGGAVGVIDQHEVWIVPQAFGLQFHGAAVLFDKLCKDKLQQLRAKRHPTKNVPSRDHVNAALIARDGGHCGQRLPARTISRRRFGRTKSIVVVMESASA